MIIVSDASLVCSLLMLITYFTNRELQVFSYTLQIYSVCGATLYALTDSMYNWLYLYFYDNSHFYICCDIASYISVYGILNIVTWTTLHIHIVKDTILQNKKSQLAKYIASVSVAFTLPIALCVIPLNFDQNIYGGFFQEKHDPDQSVCWLQYESYGNQTQKNEPDTNEKYHFTNKYTTESGLFFFYVPVILCAMLQIYDLRQISAKVEKMRLKNRIQSDHKSHLRAIAAFNVYPVFLLAVYLVPGLLYFLAMCKLPVKSLWIFQIFRFMQSFLGIVIFFVNSRNRQLYQAFLDMFSHRVKCKSDVIVSLFDPLEEYTKEESIKSVNKWDLD